MLFHSHEFIFAFLPISICIYAIVERLAGRKKALLSLLILSVIYYAFWNFIFVLLLVTSIGFNYVIGRLICRIDNLRISGLILVFGIMMNLAYLSYFKYLNFFIDNLNSWFTLSIQPTSSLFPIGISFYTFIQIGYLIDSCNKTVHSESFTNFFIFSSFFPYVTAGPLVLQKEIFAQLDHNNHLFSESRLVVGLTFFSMGLFKKVLFADQIGVFADSLFNGAATELYISPLMGWLGIASYSLQLYFDFSGYSDMALGLGYIFGIKLPLNFNSPFKATNIINFWQRWHMTMTRFFSKYIYSLMAVSMTRYCITNHYSRVLQFLLAIAFPIILTFTVAGIWHGAGWTFVIFGAIHGLALAGNYAWREAKLPQLPKIVCWLMTFFIVLISFVFFRAPNVKIAIDILLPMLGLGEYSNHAGATPLNFGITDSMIWIGFLLAIVLLFPNTQEVMQNFWISSDSPKNKSISKFNLIWKPSVAWIVVSAGVLIISILSISGDTEFLYYQF